LKALHFSVELVLSLVLMQRTAPWAVPEISDRLTRATRSAGERRAYGDAVGERSVVEKERFRAILDGSAEDERSRSSLASTVGDVLEASVEASGERSAGRAEGAF